MKKEITIIDVLEKELEIDSKQNWKTRFRELLKIFNINQIEPSENEVKLNSAVEDFIQSEIDKAVAEEREKQQKEIINLRIKCINYCEKLLNLLN